MRKPLALAIAVVVCGLIVSAAPAAWAGRGIPPRYAPASLDGRLEQVENPVSGDVWAVWSYRNGAEYDVALVSTEDDGLWSEPSFVGEFDGRDQLEPVLAADAAGNIYLAYAERSPSRIMLSWLEAGTDRWSTPVALTGEGVRATSPALRIVGERLVVAFRSGRGLVLLDLPLLEPTLHGNIFNDGPDPVEARDPDGGTDGSGEEDDTGIRPINSNGGSNPPEDDSQTPSAETTY
jgi:hypothetical protein